MLSVTDRIRMLFTNPRDFWAQVAAEDTSLNAVYIGWVLWLAALPAVAGLLGSLWWVGRMAGMLSPYMTMGAGILVTSAVLGYATTIVLVALLSWIIKALCPSFQCSGNLVQATKTVAYAMTPVWLAGILLIIPPLGAVAVLVGALYAIYLTYLALPRTLECPEDKTIAFTAVIVVVAVVVNVVLQMIVSSLTLAGTSFSTPRF
ncbi:MAG: Yip1 family protein [Acidithiobacillus sp.]|uniref:Yip1 family protein n=1 Tax=Acidithiobacillus sp. TaxID=1872118 RepID=UPI0025BD019D|nr:Yip1 family protein [Acidithiobacillus sp.]